MTPMVEEMMERAISENVTSADQGSEDAYLVTAAKGRDSHAFEILVGRYQGRILRVARQFTHNQEDAEDVAQQTFQKAFLHLHQFEGHSAFSTWLTRITINEALMWLRKKRFAMEVPIEEPAAENGDTPRPDPPDPGPSPEDSYLQRERKQILSRAINELKPSIRTAVELRDLGELSTEETAGVMKLSVGAVKARVFHGRRKLRAMLKRYFESTRSREHRQRQRTVRGRTFPQQQPACSGCD